MDKRSAMTVMQGIETEPVLDDTEDEDEYHLFCCKEDLALCGRYIGDMEMVDCDMENEVLCLFCRYIVEEGLSCPLCHSNTWSVQRLGLQSSLYAGMSA
jgi:hypothetical protein